LCYVTTSSCFKKNINAEIEYSIWDRWEINEGNFTLEQLLAYFKSQFKLKVSGVFQGSTMIFVQGFGHESRLQTKMTTLLRRKAGDLSVALDVTYDIEGNDVPGPPVRFNYKKRKSQSEKAIEQSIELKRKENENSAPSTPIKSTTTSPTPNKSVVSNLFNSNSDLPSSPTVFQKRELQRKQTQQLLKEKEQKDKQSSLNWALTASLISTAAFIGLFSWFRHKR